MKEENGRIRPDGRRFPQPDEERARLSPLLHEHSSVIRSIDDVGHEPGAEHRGYDEERDREPERHQKALPMNGSMWPQNSTATQMKIADAAAIFVLTGASMPAPVLHVPSTSMKYVTLRPPSSTKTIFQ